MKRELKSAFVEIKKGRITKLPSKAFEYFIRRTPKLKNFLNYQKTHAKIEILLKKNIGKKAKFENISIVYILSSVNEDLISRSIFSLKKQIVNPHVIFIDPFGIPDKLNSLIKNYLPKSTIIKLEESATLKDILNEVEKILDIRDFILLVNEYPKFNELCHLVDNENLLEDRSYCLDFIYPRIELKNYYIGKNSINFYENLNLFRAHFPIFSKKSLQENNLESLFKKDFIVLPACLTIKVLNKDFDDSNLFKFYFERKFSKKEIGQTGKLSNYSFDFDKKVSIIILTKDRIDLLENCLKSIEKSEYKNYEIIIVDHNSNEESQKYLRGLKHKIIKYEGEFNFSHMNNIGVQAASGDILCFMNNDVEVISKNWIEVLGAFAEREDVGVVGTKLVFKNNLIQHAGIKINKDYNTVSHILTFEKDNNVSKELTHLSSPDAVTGACVFIEKNKFLSVGGFDEEYKSIYQDIDLCLTLNAHGFKTLFIPFVKLYHFESSTRRLEPTINEKQDLRLFKRRWKKDKDSEITKEYSMFKTFNLNALKKLKNKN